MALATFKDYKNNLEIIGQNKLVSIIDENRLGIDDRYFNYYRTSYSVDEIINIVDKSFRAIFLNLDLKVKQNVDDLDDDILFLNGSIESFHHFAANNFVGEKDKERIIELIKDYTNLIETLQNKIENAVIDIPSDSEIDNSDDPLLNEDEQYFKQSNFRTRFNNSKRIINNFLQKTSLVVRCIYRRIKYGITLCVNNFIESYRR